jgi:8-oxo-dGTP pyrophosphatase MutT (NUDIX family)
MPISAASKSWRIRASFAFSPGGGTWCNTPRGAAGARSTGNLMQALRQVGALPFVETDEGLLVLLITTRGLGRWTIPKGWPKSGLSDAEMAAREAFEEAGVAGEIAPRPIAAYRYIKRLHTFSWARCTVDVYPLRARYQHLSWPEQQGRRTLWIAADQAAAKVKEAQLARLLRAVGTSVTALS